MAIMFGVVDVNLNILELFSVALLKEIIKK
jgi:hypothetical protein